MLGAQELLDQKLIFVTGKGGTGKTTFSLQLAHYFAQKGEKTLLVELGNKSSSAYLISLDREAQYKPKPMPWGFDHCLLNGTQCLEEYVSSFVKIEKLTHYFFNNPLMQRLLSLAPGLEDLALLGKLTSHLRGHGPSFNYDRIIVDSPSTGSFLSMLQAPEYLAQVVQSGPLRTQSMGITQSLENSEWVHTLFMGLFESLPVDELLESTKAFEKRFGQNYSIVMNKQIAPMGITTSQKSWSSFLEKRLNQQEALTNQLSKKEVPIYVHPLITRNLNEQMDINQKEGALFCFERL